MKGAATQKLEPGTHERSGTDLWLLDRAQASDQQWTEPCVYFATLAVRPPPMPQRTQRIKAPGNEGCYNKGNLWSISFFGLAQAAVLCSSSFTNSRGRQSLGRSQLLKPLPQIPKP